MTPPILSLHHVTATADDAQADLDFYVTLLGLRLVKKTVNFDNHHVFHFYYGNEEGTPGTLFTTFPYKGHHVPFGRKGTGQIATTAFSVPANALDAWRRRFSQLGVRLVSEGMRFDEPFLTIEDPSGLAIELIESGHDPRPPWLTADIDETFAIRGLHSVTMPVRYATASVEFLVDALGYAVAGTEGDRTRLGVGGGGAGKTVDVRHAPTVAPGVNGLGTVHHVAMAIASETEQLTIRQELLERGARVTEVLDRQYFRSIYFREPGGVLYEIATLPPGFTVDEDLSQLGRGLKLPPWEEPYRAAIEAGLPRVSH